jgi:DNA-binding FadR family transcriptional regulator
MTTQRVVDIDAFLTATGLSGEGAPAPADVGDFVERVRDAILGRRLKPGDRLPNERDLGRVLGINRSTLRERLRALEALGLIASRLGSRGGGIVLQPDERVVGDALEVLLRTSVPRPAELSEFRWSFEGETAYWAALRRTDEDCEILDGIREAFVRATLETPLPWPEVVELDTRFHVATARATHNGVRAAIMLGVYHALSAFSLSLEDRGTAEVNRESAAEFCDIVDAIREQDAERARRRVRDHIRRFALLDGTYRPFPEIGF